MKIIFIDTFFLTVQLLFEKLSHTFLMHLFFMIYLLNQKCFETYGIMRRRVAQFIQGVRAALHLISMK
jgi:hypothetical protein